MIAAHSTLSAAQIAQLTAVVTGGAFKRAATREAATKRFLSTFEARVGAPIVAASQRDILAAGDFETGRAMVEAAIRQADEAKAAPAKAPKQDKAQKSPREDFRANATEIVRGLVEKFGPGKVGKFRAQWINRDPDGFGKLASTQQKGIFRKAINKLVEDGAVKRDGSTFAKA